MRGQHAERRAVSPNPVTIRVPFTLRRRGGRKTMMMTLGGETTTTMQKPTGHANTAFVHALAMAFRWRRLLETGLYSTAAEIAVAERVNDSYVSRVLRLTLLAPCIVEAIMDERRATPVRLAPALEPFPIEWPRQRMLLNV